MKSTIVFQILLTLSILMSLESKISFIPQIFTGGIAKMTAKLIKNPIENTIGFLVQNIRNKFIERSQKSSEGYDKIDLIDSDTTITGLKG